MATKRTYQPSKTRRARRHGFLVRSRTPGGRKVLRNRRGVCQDFAHVAITCFRALGLPARYISGYLRTRPAAGKERRDA